MLFCFFVVRSEQRLKITGVICVELPLNNLFGWQQSGDVFLD